MHVTHLVKLALGAALATVALGGTALAQAGTQSAHPSGEIIAVLKHSPNGQIIAILKQYDLIGLLEHPEMRKAGGDVK